MVLIFKIAKLFFAMIIIISAIPGMIKRQLFFSYMRDKEISADSVSVVVNGPSLNLGKISRTSDCICVNQFCLLDEFDELRPKFYVLLDPRYANKNDTNSSFYKAVEGINKRTHWPLKLFIPRHFRSSISSRINNNNIDICSYPATPFPANEIPTPLRPFLYRTAWMTPPASNVLVHTIYMAIHLGFEEINLHGADMNFFQSVTKGCDGTPHFKRRHFYGVEDVPLGMCMTRFFQEQYQSFASFGDLAKVARYRGLKIINHSPHSMIDVFDEAASYFDTEKVCTPNSTHVKK